MLYSFFNIFGILLLRQHIKKIPDDSYEALKACIIAGLNVSLSGNPFWGWDIAGFSGDLPEIDLYKRSCELAIFTPIFQFHSEHSGDPVPSAERSPWNIAKYYNDIIKYSIFIDFVLL
ncbi:TIM-barrel domain-containing protein [Petrotoga sp. 9PWA.NaAc.5.4]|uniref:TIM-barrel domain-containing protein n=1 Tax=Petrotoga sp. 9PWA.NaAc.5.4 TaxID=1434328 RepID=UPI000CB15E36|nr:TIM-barrel domain-containing protein [Petrotoga sp. 9PWA.NaAc.5.4]PNR96830.1 hypothetical protein X924_02090 [Petrotoga sp. 9PWA.NaAc.5.4]